MRSGYAVSRLSRVGSDLLLSIARPEHSRADLGCSVLLHGGEHVAVDIERDRDGGVAQPLLHDPGVDALMQGEGRVRMPQVVVKPTSA